MYTNTCTLLRARSCTVSGTRGYSRHKTIRGSLVASTWELLWASLCVSTCAMRPRSFTCGASSICLLQKGPGVFVDCCLLTRIAPASAETHTFTGPAVVVGGDKSSQHVFHNRDTRVCVCGCVGRMGGDGARAGIREATSSSISSNISSSASR